MLTDTGFKAIAVGLISAATLPLGALLSRFWKPGNRTVAAMMAFGAGALLCALSIDLIGKAVEHGHFYPMAIGALCGGLLFSMLNRLVNMKGGFLRKAATTVNYLKTVREKEMRTLVRRLSRLPLFTSLPPEEIRSLILRVEKRHFAPGEHLFNKGDPADCLHIIASGTADVFVDPSCPPAASLSVDDIVGEMALVTGDPRTATVTARTRLTTWRLSKNDFDHFLSQSPRMTEAVYSLVAERINDLRDKRLLTSKHSRKWARRAARKLSSGLPRLSSTDIQNAAAAHSGAPLAIFLGIMLDGIPESLVLGASSLEAGLSISLIAGLFLSNFPEALSSSDGMAENGMKHTTIMSMWLFLMLFTGFGAWMGSIFFAGAPPFAFALIEGLAAGAMLTMIAETMLPEAFHKGGAITGIATLLGFLTAVFFKTFE